MTKICHISVLSIYLYHLYIFIFLYTIYHMKMSFKQSMFLCFLNTTTTTTNNNAKLLLLLH